LTRRYHKAESRRAGREHSLERLLESSSQALDILLASAAGAPSNSAQRRELSVVEGAEKAHDAMPHDPRRRHDVTPIGRFPHSSWPILKDDPGNKRALRLVWNLIQ
jgi:hypothetical protein